MIHRYAIASNDCRGHRAGVAYRLWPEQLLELLMPIPEFADHGALPPFIAGNATNRSARSPFQATMQEVVSRFCTSLDRARLLKGLNEYRKHLHAGGFVSGSQWLDGSFVENVEAIRKRSPSDIDVVTLFNRPIRYQIQPEKWITDYERHIHPEFFDSNRMKPIYRCDTYSIDLDAPSGALVRNSTYWFGLFSDMRSSAEKKGIIEIPLAIDAAEFISVDREIRGRYDV